MIVECQGHDVFVSDGGMPFDADKPSVVMVHGVGMDHTVWGQQTRYLAHHGFNVLSVDLPGHGKSKGTAFTSIEEMSDWLAAFIDSAKAGPAIVAGHSMGSLIALECAATHPDQVRGLILCGASAAMGVHPALLEAAEQNLILAPELISSWGHGPRAHRGGNIASGVWLVGGAVRLLERAADGLIAGGLSACAAYKGAAAAASKITVPVLILSGQHDKMTPAKAARPLLDGFANGKQTVLPNVGHMMMLEAPDDVRRSFYDFARQVAAS